MNKIIRVLLPALLLVFIACEDEDNPKIYDPNYDPGPRPVIASMDPADSTYAGVGNITITGQNFTPQEPYGEHNQVYFDKIKADVVSATPTQLVIGSPSYIKDQIKVKIASRQSDLFSDEVLYKLKAAVDTTFGNLDNLPKSHVVYGIASDMNRNIYISATIQGDQLRGTILMIDPEGVLHTVIDQTDYLKADAMKMGPDNKLYVAMVLGRPKQIRVIDVSALPSDDEIFATLAVNPRDMDFDADGNLWVVGVKSLMRVKPDKTVQSMADFPVDLTTVRVYEDSGTPYVYVGGKDIGSGEHKIWRREIKNDDTLGDAEVVVDLAAGGWIGNGKITALTFSADGRMYIGTNSSPDALFIYDPATGSHEVLFPGLIFPNIYAFIWAEGNYIYAAQQNPGQTSGNLLKIDAGTVGAPYFGR